MKAGHIVRVGDKQNMFKGFEGHIVDRPYNAPSGTIPVLLKGFGIQYFEPSQVFRVPQRTYKQADK